jgi:membrane-bound lytic murein transglycosylase A
LERASFSDLPGWKTSDPVQALAAFQRGCVVLVARPPATDLGYAGRVSDWQGVCAAAQGTQDARAYFENHFTPYAITGDTLFTGYYEPQINGSHTRTGAYQTPVYGPPPDLIRVDLSQFSEKFKGEHVSGLLVGQSLKPYPDRAAIDAHGIANAKILFWTDDPVALFFLQIQGSGRVRFTDGGMERVAYAGENGRPYTAIGRILIKSGALTKQNVSLASIRAWLKAHPGQQQKIMETDQSFVFFQETPVGDPALGSPGTQGVGLTPLASIAIDPRIHALGTAFYVAATGPDPVRALAIGQDTGGAIRGAPRADIFFGFGPDAERRAGGMKAGGTLYVLLPNAVAQRLGASADLPL